MKFEDIEKVVFTGDKKTVSESSDFDNNLLYIFAMNGMLAYVKDGTLKKGDASRWKEKLKNHREHSMDRFNQISDAQKMASDIESDILFAILGKAHPCSIMIRMAKIISELTSDSYAFYLQVESECKALYSDWDKELSREEERDMIIRDMQRMTNALNETKDAKLKYLFGKSIRCCEERLEVLGNE